MAKQSEQGNYGTFQDPDNKDRVVVAFTVEDAVRLRHDGWQEVIAATHTAPAE